MTKILEMLHSFLWGVPALIFILGVGIYLTVRTGAVQFALFPRAIRVFFASMSSREGGSFRALCTALAATVGTGNLVGVAGAICLGGPGAIFWMWISGLLGMVTKYAEVTLAVRYRKKQQNMYLGGPMYMISLGLGQRWRWLAKVYCIFGVIASFGVGNAAQINALTTGIHTVLKSYPISSAAFFDLGVGIVLSLVVGAMLSGGAKRIGSAAECLVPVVSLGYILLCTGVLVTRWYAIGGAFRQIFHGAFSPKAITGGVIGSAFRALKVGCSRGVFTNEAGMGTASIAHAAVSVAHPAQQGLMGIMEVFLDTILICTLTALAILVSGVEIPYGTDAGAELTGAAFSTVYGDLANVFLTVSLCCFAFATILGWGLYGGRCAQYVFGSKAWRWYVFLQMAAACLGTLVNTDIIWLFAETANGLMIIPNLFSMAALSPELLRLTIDYKEKPAYN